jgi:hypothetical protein
MRRFRNLLSICVRFGSRIRRFRPGVFVLFRLPDLCSGFGFDDRCGRRHRKLLRCRLRHIRFRWLRRDRLGRFLRFLPAEGEDLLDEVERHSVSLNQAARAASGTA